MESNFLKNLFNRGGGGGGEQQQLAIQNSEGTPKRGFYKREEDRDFEMIHQLDETIAQCDRSIERYNGQLTPIMAELRSLKQQLDKLKNKEGPQAAEITSKATRLMHQRETLKKRIAHYEQQRLTLKDVYVPGCPPRPEALLEGMLMLQAKIRTESMKNKIFPIDGFDEGL